MMSTHPQTFLTRDMRHLVALVQTDAAVDLVVHRCPSLDPLRLHRLSVLTDHLREVLTGERLGEVWDAADERKGIHVPR